MGSILSYKWELEVKGNKLSMWTTISNCEFYNKEHISINPNAIGTHHVDAVRCQRPKFMPYQIIQSCV